tara:strand:+ start:733 stop:924 length:192 start_codon:yes stop_codon:yes gene_type:complete
MEAQELYEKAKKIAYKKQVSTDSILNPMLIEHGYKDKNGMALKTICITIGITEDLNEIPKEQD